MSGIKLLQIVGLREIPDTRKLDLQRVDKLRADKGHDSTNAGSFIEPQIERFPFQMGMPRDHQGVIKDERLDRHKKFLGQLLPTDQDLHDHYLKESRVREEERRVEVRHAVERRTAEFYDHAAVQGEIDRRVAFFAKAKKIMESRVDAQTKARQLMMEYFEFVRSKASDEAIGWTLDTRRRILEAEENRREWREWRLYDLFTTTINGTVARAPGRGQKREIVAGEMYARQTKQMVEDNWAWRDGNYYYEAANGAMIRDTQGRGVLRDKLLSDIFLPVILKRSRDFLLWHESNSLIETPNGSLRRAAGQGSMPEKANAELSEPVRQRRTEEHWDYQFGGRLVSLPNGSMASRPGLGIQPEVLRADKYWPERAEVTRDIDTWHENNKIAMTPNGGFAPLATVGQAYTKVTADQAQPLKDQRTEGHADWHANHRFERTPNGGFAPLANVGNSIEKASADFAAPIRERQESDALEWHASHRFGPTPNGGFAPLVGVGESYEKTTADHIEPTVRRRTADHTNAYESNRYASTSNGAMGQLKVVGENPEKISGDLSDMTEDEILKGWSEERLHAKENFREQVELKDQQVSKSLRDTELSERRDLGLERADPLPGVGEPQSNATRAIANQRVMKQKMALREIQRNLAAHEPAVSQLQDHAVKRQKG